jgi:hypothetical protein
LTLATAGEAADLDDLWGLSPHRSSRSLRILRRADEAGVVGGDDQLGAVAGSQLREQAADVRLGAPVPLCTPARA